MVREGLVRCWNCGGFLRAEMEQKFQKMQSQPPKVILSQTHEPDADHSDLDLMMSRDSKSDGSGEDFQISTPVRQAASPTTEGGTAEEKPGDETPEKESADTEEKPTDEAKQKESPEAAADGDALLELAAAEEQERQKRQGSGPAAIKGVKVIRDGFLIDTPKGCRIQVRDEQTGEMRRLTFGANSRVRISMLDKLEAIAKARKEAAAKEARGPKHLSAGKYQRWMSEVHMHTINPAKLKLVADSLVKEFVVVELGFAEDELIAVTLPVAKKSLFGGGKGPSTAEEAREALFERLRAGKSIQGDDIAVVGDVNQHYTADQAAELRIVQPASPAESLFAGIPVFGQGRIAVQLPIKEAGEQPKVLSFTLSQFREFVEIVSPLYSLPEFGRNLGIPLSDSFEEHKCHFSGSTVRALEHVEFYNADPKLETVIAGWKCEECGIAISEEAREEKKLGGKGGKGIAKAKCPKCEKKMGNVPLYTLPPREEEPSEAKGDQTETAADAKPVEAANPSAEKPAAEDAAAAEDTAAAGAADEKADGEAETKQADAAKTEAAASQPAKDKAAKS